MLAFAQEHLKLLLPTLFSIPQVQINHSVSWTRRGGGCGGGRSSFVSHGGRKRPACLPMLGNRASHFPAQGFVEKTFLWKTKPL